MAKHDTKMRKTYLQPIWSVVPKVVTPILKKRGFRDANILKDWATIVGPQWAEWTILDRVYLASKKRKHGTLHLKVYGSAAVMIKHIEPAIIERVNNYLGYQGVTKLRITQYSAPAKKQKSSIPTKVQTNLPVPELDDMPDSALKNSLKRLGLSMRSNN